MRAPSSQVLLERWGWGTAGQREREGEGEIGPAVPGKSRGRAGAVPLMSPPNCFPGDNQWHGSRPWPSGAFPNILFTYRGGPGPVPSQGQEVGAGRGQPGPPGRVAVVRPGRSRQTGPLAGHSLNAIGQNKQAAAVTPGLPWPEAGAAWQAGWRQTSPQTAFHTAPR